MDSPSASELALADLDSVLTQLWEALEAGAADAYNYFEEHGEKVNRTLFPCLVRYRAIQVLESAGVQASEIERATIANNGIEVRYGRYSVRVLKADGGEVPPAGSSDRKRTFYHQGSLFPSLGEGGTNLLVLWDYDGQAITELMLACPLAPESKTEGVKVAWMLPIAHPTVGAAAPPESGDDDLPITYRQRVQDNKDAG